jgi:NAD(P)-dependent dehydrogenase (short-subunit alcohol dehydrogenase family)
LKDRVAIVTGAGAAGPGWGNGKAIAALFAREGAKIFGVDINGAAAEETRGVIADEGGTCVAHTADVSSATDVEGLVAACLDAFGRIDILVNNVGIVRLGGPVELEESAWDRVTDVNLKSVYLTAKHVLPVMERQGIGVIVNISSVAAIRYSGIDYASYYATKGAILPLTRAIALQYAKKGIRANCVLPGLMDTPLVRADLAQAYDDAGDIDRVVEARAAQCPMGHMGDAWDTAHAALFLASDEARYITATELLVDGGVSAGFA